MKKGLIKNTVMKTNTNVILFTIWIAGTFAFSCSQSNSTKFSNGLDYDARIFLTHTQITSFNKLYPEFDSAKAIKNWEWKDVDPLGLFMPEQNRARRRKLFLFEHNPQVIGTESPTNEQLALKFLFTQQIKGAEIIQDNSNIKIISPYTTSYEKDLPLKNLLEKVSDLGLQWGQAGGQNLYIYNGDILLGKFKSGFVSLTDINIDKPNKDYKGTEQE
jgi:hypothetical protein